jgi:peptidoglycan/xylan/chitin deacetylase (PgdA/CDA1 family)
MAPQEQPHRADPSLRGKLRRRYARLVSRRPARGRPERPMLSISFDDAPASAAAAGAAILERRGLKGTYVRCTGLAGREGPMGRIADAVDIERLIAAGHEIACHTWSHLDCGQASASAIAEDVVKNKAGLVGLGAPEPATFAYPYGDVSPWAKAVLAPRFQLLRGLHHGLVRRGSDLNQAPAVGVEGEDGEALAWRWLDRAISERAWLILYTHDVADDPSPWGCTPAALERLIDAALASGVEIVTVAEGVHRIQTTPPAS